MNIIGLILVFIGAVIEVFADIAFKWWNDRNEIHLIIVGVILYLTGTAFWVASLRYESFTKSGTVFLLLNIILLTMAGLLLFKDNISDINRLGIILGIISIIMIEY